MLFLILVCYFSVLMLLNRSVRNMATRKCGMLVKEAIEKLENFAPLSLAESWDNVGLLVDPMNSNPINTILLTNDLTEDVVGEAISSKSGLIVSYHPNIFQGLKSVTSRTWKERIVVQCLQNSIAVFSPHTSWDSVVGGVNDWLAKCFDYNTIKPIQPTAGNSNQGLGRLLTLPHPISLNTALDRIKNHIKIPHLRFGLGRGKDLANVNIAKVALCAGSGSSVLRGVEADLYLTGEMLHHDILDATQKGVSVILCNHSDSERGFLKEFQTILANDILLGAVDVLVSEKDSDPLLTY